MVGGDGGNWQPITICGLVRAPVPCPAVRTVQGPRKPRKVPIYPRARGARGYNLPDDHRQRQQVEECRRMAHSCFYHQPRGVEEVVLLQYLQKTRTDSFRSDVPLLHLLLPPFHPWSSFCSHLLVLFLHRHLLLVTTTMTTMKAKYAALSRHMLLLLGCLHCW